MRSTAILFLSFCLLVACGSKDNVSTLRGDEELIGSGGQGQIGQPSRPVDGAAPSAGSLVQIACQTDSPLGFTTLPNSQMAAGQRFVDSVPRLREGEKNEAPTVLGLDGNIASLLVIAGGKLYFVRHDLAAHKLLDQPVAIGSAGSRSASVYRSLGFSQPRLAAASPDSKVFVIAGKGELSLRAANNPTETASSARVSGSFAQPRWDGSDIFVDRVSGGRLRQTLVNVGVGYSSLSARNVPEAIGSGFDQIGLRRFDAGRYIWLERNGKRSVLRLWNASSGAVQNYELPNGGIYGPGFALYRQAPAAEAQAVLNSKEGMHYFRLAADGGVMGAAIAYPEDTQRMINNPERANTWYPGALYSAAGDTQLFTVIPSTFGGQMLMAVDRQYSYRLLGFESCVNPDFHQVGE